MPDIDPAALSRSDPITTAAPASLSLSKANGVTPISTTKATKTVNTVQRIDLEPLYTSLKAAIGDNWANYKEAISLFILGQLNQNELSFRIDYFVTADPQVEHMHNALIAAIYGNVSRDPPEPGVAPWVSANDKPTIVSKPVAGDAAEQRLKTEVMQLPPKDRRRLKAIPERDQNEDSLVASRNEYRASKIVRLPDTVPASAGGLNKTNWDLEVRKRYSQPLACETGEFPDTDSIQARMTPICYQESLPNGCAPTCAEFMAAATEQFLKEVVGNVLSRTRSNIVAGGVGGSNIMTYKYRQQLNRETAAFDEGKLQKTPLGNMLPVEVKEALNRRTLGLEDFRVALNIGGCSLGQMPDITQNVMNGYQEGILEGWGRYSIEEDATPGPSLISSKAKGNQINASHVNGSTSNDVSGWAGAGEEDRHQLFSVLDDCLAVGRS